MVGPSGHTPFLYRMRFLFRRVSLFPFPMSNTVFISPRKSFPCRETHNAKPPACYDRGFRGASNEETSGGANLMLNASPDGVFARGEGILASGAVPVNPLFCYATC